MHSQFRLLARIRPLLAAAVLVGSAASAQTTAPAGGGASTLDRVQQAGVLRVCTTGDYKPFSYLRPEGGFEGMDIDLAQSLSQALGVRAEFVRTSWSTLMADFTAGKCDVGAGGISVTLERLKKAGFSIPYMVDGKSPIARCADAQRYQTLEDIDQPAVRVIVNPGGTNERFARANLKRAQLIVHPDNVTIFDRIDKGEADVMITDGSETLLQHKLHPSLCPIHPERPFQYGEKAVLLPRDDPAFKAFVDAWLHLLRETGEYGRIESHWLR